MLQSVALADARRTCRKAARRRWPGLAAAGPEDPQGKKRCFVRRKAVSQRRSQWKDKAKGGVFVRIRKAKGGVFVTQWKDKATGGVSAVKGSMMLAAV